MNQHTGDLTSAIMAAAASPTGARTDNIAGYTTMQVGRMVQKLCARGELFVAKLSHRNARYFSTKAAADALAAQPATVSIRKRLAPHSAWADIAPAVIPKGLKPVECPSPPQHRYETKECVYKPFSSLPLGVYALPASKWVEEVTT